MKGAEFYQTKVNTSYRCSSESLIHIPIDDNSYENTTALISVKHFQLEAFRTQHGEQFSTGLCFDIWTKLLYCMSFEISLINIYFLFCSNGLPCWWYADFRCCTNRRWLCIGCPCSSSADSILDWTKTCSSTRISKRLIIWDEIRSMMWSKVSYIHSRRVKLLILFSVLKGLYP